jgi:peptidoglycan/xylan/chitin deacetylase (PgdA/CDA1 family)
MNRLRIDRQTFCTRPGRTAAVCGPAHRLAGLMAAMSVMIACAAGLRAVAVEPPGGTAKGFGENLLVNGDFSADLAGWDVKGKAQVQTLDGVTTLAVTTGGLVQQIALDPAWRTLRVTLRLRATGVEVGDQDWKTARLAMCFFKADGQKTKGWPNVFMSSGTTGWAVCQRDYAIPEDAVRLEVSAANFGTSGHADFQDIRIEALDPEKAAVPAAPSGITLLSTPDAVAARDLPDRAQFHLFVLMGQSNMHGLAPPVAAYRKPHPRVLSLQLDGQWAPARTPLDMWRVGGFSLAESFGRHYAELHPGVTVGLIMAAQAGDSIDELSKGAVDRNGRAVYDDSLRLITPALAQGTLKAVLWQQGTANLRDKAYTAKLKSFIEQLRTDLRDPAVPFIAGELGRFTPGTAPFNAALSQLLATIPNTRLASSEGLTDRGDQLHFSGESAELYGRRFLAEYLAAVEPQLASKVDTTAPASAATEAAAASPGKAPVILLKLDDVSYWISPRWQRTADYLATNNLKAAFGIIGGGLEKAGPETVRWIRERRQSGLVEFWLHGYTLRTAADTGEFEQGTVAEQQAILEKVEGLAREKLGFELNAFGAHWSNTTPETEQAVEAVPAIKVWLYGPKDSKFYTRRSLPCVMGLENPTFIPDFEKFKAAYEKTGCLQEVLVLQGHPDAWGDEVRWGGFVKIIAFLKSKGCVFMTPSEYLARGSAAAADTFPFAMPWNDTRAGVATDVSFLNEKPAGKNGPIIVKDGHFAEQDTGRRIRFFGVNMGGSEAFPEQADAVMFARRLAKAGVNIVRLHHLDNSWPTPGCSIWDRNYADRQHFDAAQLDKLDYLIDQLKRNGIYVNLNLKVSKHLSAADGLPESIAQVPFLHQKRIDFFQRRMIELQKDYARNLLTHTNAYTGFAYSADPAVACIEINNENSLLGFWTRSLGRGLETLPEPFKTELETLWTAWLRERYASTAALANAWMENTTPPGASLLSPKSVWTFESHAPSVATIIQTPGTDPQAAPAVGVTVKQNDPVEWHIQAHLAGLTLTDGAMYTVSFRARAEKPGALRVNVRKDVDDWSNMGLEAAVDVGTELRPFTLTFRAASTVPGHARLGFVLGRFTGAVEITDVRLAPGVKDAGLQENDALDTRIHVPTVMTDRQESDWLAFLIDTERAYADEMRRLLKDELKVRANVALTQIDYGGTSGMYREQQMDFADSHAYWQHPSFANNDWNPDRWMIPNTPQVAVFGDDRFGELGQLALVRVADKPFTVSEYDHPAPSDYACEMLPELSAFAALQDWDAIYTFAITTYASSRKPDSIQGYFDQNNHPAKWAFYPTAALIFRQGLIPPASAQATLRLGAGLWRDYTFTDEGWRALSGAAIGFLTRRLAVSDQPLPAGEKSAITGQGPLPKLETVRLQKTKAGQVFIAAAPAIVAFAGYVGGETLVAGGCTLTTDAFGNNFAAVTAVATDGQPLGASRRVLVTICGRVENQGMGWNAARTTVGSKWGQGPTVAQHVPARLAFTVEGDRKVFALAPDGARAGQVPATRQGDQLTFTVEAADRTLFYELTADD